MLSYEDIALALIKKWEECSLTAYQDVAGIWTIGWGSLVMPDGSPVQDGDQITQDEADDMLYQAMASTVDQVTLLAPTANANQLGALISFAYNEGVTALRTSTLLRLFNAGDVQGAADQFPLWDKAHVDNQLVTVQGLLNRRESEQAVFLGKSSP